MAIGLSQSEMDSFAGDMLALLPSEATVYRVGSTDVEVCGHFLEFTKHELAIDPMLRNMRRFRVASADLASPARNAVVVRNAGTATETKWDVDVVAGGPGRPFWFLTVRQVK